jgi:Tetracyclin repressor-like, C-terminal domain
VPVLGDRARTPTDRIRAIVAIHLRMSDERRCELLVGTAVRYALTPRQRREGTTLQQTYHDAVREVITEGNTSGEFHVDDPDLTTMAVLDMLNGVREWFDRTGRLTLDQVIDRYTTLTITLLRPWVS